MQDLQILQDAARIKKMAKLLQDVTKQTRTRKCKTFKCCKMLLEDGEARRRRKERQLIDGRPSTAANCCQKTKVTKRDVVVASTRHHRARLLKYYPRPPCAPSFVKSRIFRPLLFQQIFFVLVCIHAGTSRVPPRVLASGPKPCGGNNDQMRKSTYSFRRTSSAHQMEGTIDTNKRTILSPPKKNRSSKKNGRKGDLISNEWPSL